MNTIYVQRDSGKIVGVYACLQPGYADEELSSDDPEVIAFLNPSPPVTVPIISKRQAKLALLETGNLDAVEAYVKAQGPLAEIYWNDSTEFHKDNPILVNGAIALNLDIDQLFTLASTL